LLSLCSRLVGCKTAWAVARSGDEETL
jgi:hypothetical protein